ncbi:formiminoglutamase [Polaribacter irgensii 23-P]|uniref:Formimidoylglutamase n=1 Tax=Polaribacter irgensii 23-P TaxID=313594 RepID=A4BW34_9FLAO|nr:formimidoylglutamase [Polaribacter irgensii]EAR13175.1 formiminoglutamase [Polaribacter irgensii 23-P]
MSFFKELKVAYQAGDKEWYSGRASQLENQYWHQSILVSDLENLKISTTKGFGIVGYVCDAGVKKNQGRIGAQKGPKSIRAKIGRLPIHFENRKVTDFGDVICLDEDLEDCQKALSKTIHKLILNNILPIAIGGGHDIAYANFNGIKEALKNVSENKIGIINFDAHFDLRAVEIAPNSGTPFHQILSENTATSYFAIGIQQQANTKELFEIARKRKVSYVSNLECETFDEALKSKLNKFLKKIDYLYITIDLDGFSSAYAPGVSAPSALGFTPNFVYKALAFLLQSKKVISCDIAELNPDFDIDNRTADLAAKLVDYIVQKA